MVKRSPENKHRAGLRILIGIFSMFVFFTHETAGGFPALENMKRKNVLFLALYQIDMPANRLAVQALQEEFQKSPDFAIDLFYEYLDANRFRRADHLATHFDFLKKKYHGVPIDLVIVGNKTMLELWLSHGRAILPATPVIFYDMILPWLSGFRKPQDVTGVAGEVNLAKSVRWLMNARPSINEIIVVHGAGESDKLYLSNVNAMLEELRGQVKLTNWSALPLAEMKRRAALLPNTSAIVYSLLFEDAARVTYRPMEALRELADVSSVPVLSAYDQFIGTGTVGGFMYSIDAQARAVAQIGLRILGGEKANSIPVMVDAGNRFIFDHRVLQRWDIPLSLLPPGSIVKNRQYSFWEQYRYRIIGVISTFTVMLILIVFLVKIAHKLSRARYELSRMNIKLEQEVQERTTELVQVNATLRESEEKFRILAEKSPVMIFINRKGRVVYANPRCEEIMGYAREEFYSDGFDFQILIAPEYRDAINASFKKHLAGEEAPHIEYALITKDGRRIEAIITTKLIKFENAPSILGIITDITDRKRIEEMLRRTEANLRSLMNATSETMFLMESDGTIIDLNEITAARLNTTIPRMQGHNMFDFLPPETAAYRRVFIDQLVETGRPVSFEDERNGLWMKHHIYPILDDSGHVVRMGVFARDITGRKEAEEKIHNLLREKDMILKEVHHRVKNNMNVIMGLLNLQADSQEDKALKSVLVSSASRVRSMMVLYDKLYRSEKTKDLSMKEYLPDLINEIVSIFPFRGSLKIKTRIDDIVLSTSKLSPIGIIINELITNALKYAFTGRDSGIISVAVSRINNLVSLVFEDNGTGIPETVTSDNSPGFGLQLVTMLVKQIKGSLVIDRDQGTRISIEFDA